eukprot:8341075-Alexandrium_andersonii.AAC.1
MARQWCECVIPKTALPKTQTHCKCSDPDLRGPKSGLDIGHRNRRGLNTARSFARTPNLPRSMATEG